MTTSVGLCVANSAGKRARPPDVVSPLILALTTVAAIFSRTKRCSIRATHPVPRLRPYSALSESPTTKIVADGGTVAGAAAAGKDPASPANKPSAIQCLRTKESPMSEEVIISVEHVCKSVTDSTGTLEILRDIDFALKARETAAIVGASGSGKSTLLSIIAGLDTPTTGTVHLAGTDLFAMDEDARAGLRASKVGFVFQSFQLLGNLTALENVMLPLELASRKDARQAATDMLARVGLSQRLSSYPKVLSGGEQQRVALARAFVVHPAVLLADEPTGSLDFATGEKIMELMFDLNREQGTTLVLVTHDRAIAQRCDRRITIEAGRVV
jgi:putative ABC transport system ATP-binding protein